MSTPETPETPGLIGPSSDASSAVVTDAFVPDAFVPVAAVPVAVVPVADRRSTIINILGWVALGLAFVGVLMALDQVGSFFAGVALVPAFVIGLGVLVLRSERLWASVIAVIASVIGGYIAIIGSFLTIIALTGGLALQSLDFTGVDAGFTLPNISLPNIKIPSIKFPKMGNLSIDISKLIPVPKPAPKPKPTASPSASPSAPPSPTPQPTVDPVVFTLGQTATDASGTQFTVQGITCGITSFPATATTPATPVAGTDGTAADTVTPDGEFCEVVVVVTNGSDAAEDLAMTDLTEVAGVEGQQGFPVVSGVGGLWSLGGAVATTPTAIPTPPTLLESSLTVAPGARAGAVLLFDVPQGTSLSYLFVGTSWFDGTALFALT